MYYHVALAIDGWSLLSSIATWQGLNKFIFSLATPLITWRFPVMVESSTRRAFQGKSFAPHSIKADI